MSYPLFYKLTFQNAPFFYKLPIESSIVELMEKEYDITRSHCTPMLDCTTDNIVEKMIYSFYDNPPYQNTFELEEEYNKILSYVKIIFDNSLQSIEEVHFNNSPITTMNEEEFKNLTQDKCLIISSILH